MEETPNVNNLNGIPNFGHGMPADGEVVAGVTDVPQAEVVAEEVVKEEVVVDVPEESPEELVDR